MEHNNIHIPIREWAEDDRPREKLLSKGKNSLSDAELIAILLGTGNRSDTAVDLAKRVLQQCSNSLVTLSKQSVKDLQKFEGIGGAKAVNIIAGLELGRRRQGAEVLEREKITCSKDVFSLFQSLLGDKEYEYFCILLLDRANKVISPEMISEGGVSGTVADPKKIFRIVLEKNGSSVILCHNHPSGNIEPSEADIRLTRKLKEAGSLLDIQVLDHLIIGDDKYYSFADENMI